MKNEVQVKKENDLKIVLAKNYQNQIKNYFGDEKKAMKFLSSVISAVQRTPKLLECDQTSVINSFMQVAQMEFMPSDVSGEAYVLPYGDKAQFQLGYQGLVTLFYRAGVKDITAEIVYEKDKFSFKNGVIDHEPDVFADDRGAAKGAYVIITTQTGGKISKVMSKKDIIEMGENFSKSYFQYDYKTKRKTDKVGEYTPWNPKNDPELWMWKKTVLKQAAKLVPKNETINKAVAWDNQDSVIADRRLQEAKKNAAKSTMGDNVKLPTNKKKDEKEKSNK